MFKKIAIAATLAVLASSSFAADTVGGYAGIDVGATKFDTISGNKTSFGGFAGYQFSENFAVEGGLRSLGTVTIDTVDVKNRQLSLSALGMLPLNKEFSVFGRLGYNDIKSTGSAGGRSASISTSGGLYGIGMGYAFTPEAMARVELQKPTSDSSNVSVSLAFKF